MSLEEIRRIIEEARWFSRLGSAEAGPGFVAVSVDEWADFVGSPGGAGAGDLRDAPGDGSLWRMDWLPTSPDQGDPVHGDALRVRVAALGKADACRADRLEIHAQASVSLQGSTERPLLRPGAMDLRPTAQEAALFACRVSVSEVAAGEPGFWCSLLPLYGRGNWPLGRIPGGAVVVL